MRRLINALKSVSLKKILTVALVGILVVGTTACSNSPSAQVPTGQYQSLKTPDKELYDPVQSKKSDGMYPYEDMDVEPSARTKQKVRELVDNADKNINKVNNPGEFVQNFKEGTPINKRVENLSEDVAESAQKLTQDVASGAKRNAQKLKENTQNAIENPETILNNSK